MTGKVTQAARMLELAAHFRRRGKVVVIGGPYASLSPERCRDHADVLVVGELEPVADELFTDLDRGTWKKEYRGGRADLSRSPLPRWDLYRTERALTGCVQVSRGCPFECEFCDVIQYLGRTQRAKPTLLVLAELDHLYALGFRSVFLADDNFTVNRRWAKEVLVALRRWNAARSDGPVAFTTQVSIDAARDAQLLRLMAEAGLTSVFLGLETPNVESLREAKKRQNLGVDLLAQVDAFLAHGVAVIGGMIVGFDHDGPDIFERQLAFAMASPIAVFSVGALTAPAATPLYARMKAAGRLLSGGSEVAARPWDTNIVPALMSRDELFKGLRWLCAELYAPFRFQQRLLRMIAALPPTPLGGNEPLPGLSPRAVEREARVVVDRLRWKNPEMRSMVTAVLRSVREKPWTGGLAMQMLFRYAQICCVFEQGELSARNTAEQLGA